MFKRIIPIIALITSISILFSCKAQKAAVKKDADGNLIYPVKVSFISIGAGTDGESIVKFNDFITNYKPALKVEKSPWGREGEVDFCFELTELKVKQQQQFIKEVKNLFAGKDLVRVAENVKCSGRPKKPASNKE